MLYAIHYGQNQLQASPIYGTGVAMYLKFRDMESNGVTPCGGWADLYVVDTSKPYDSDGFTNHPEYGCVDSISWYPEDHDD